MAGERMQVSALKQENKQPLLRGAIAAKQSRIVWIAASACGLLAMTILTFLSLKPVKNSLHTIASDAQVMRITDRNGIPLGISYQNRWNSYDHAPLYAIPDFLKAAFVFSEDRDFFEHQGVDWAARVSALGQNFRKGRNFRGASTITEQVVRMINPRPRTLWARWLEGFEAAELERSASKADILEFYLNQVPYASNRRGIVQAARHYFNRDLSTLSLKEMLALAVLVRAPSGYDLYRYPDRIEAPVRRLAQAMHAAGRINEQQYGFIATEKLRLKKPALPVDARHFARFVRLNTHPQGQDIFRTTLDSNLQKQIQEIVDTRMKILARKNVRHAAAIVADYRTGEILAWVAGGTEKDTSEIDTVTAARQPGSAMKPFLYALALEKGWTAATILNDSPLAEAVGGGLHRFRNYSNVHYGPITMREALGNSLNIPALLAIRHVGAGGYLTTLQHLGFKSLNLASGLYDEGLALGNGEVTLLEMAQAYAALANGGLYQPFHVLQQEENTQTPLRVYSRETASLIGNILSDPSARTLEFGAGSILNMPVQTAVKTGTSTDYRDAWVLGYNDRYVVGLWMGNLDGAPMEGVTGSTGPALALRGIFALLNKGRETAPLYLSPRLMAKDVCTRPVREDAPCPTRSEWFIPGTTPAEFPSTTSSGDPLELARPTEGLQIAYDPRIPAAHQKFRFELRGLAPGSKAKWMLDGQTLGEGEQPHLLWPVTRGRHSLAVHTTLPSGRAYALPPVAFIVK